MHPGIITVALCVLDVLFCLCMLTLLIASAPNSSPRTLAVIKSLMWTVLLAAAVIPVAVVFLWTGRHPLAMLLSAIPLQVCLLVFALAFELSDYQVNPEKIPSVGRIIGKIGVVLVFGGGGMVLFYVGGREYAYQRALIRHSVIVPAQIIESKVGVSVSNDTDRDLVSDNSTTSYTPDVRFRYTLQDKTYESDKLRPSAIVRGYASQQSAAEEIAPFPVGKTVEAYVNPALPHRAFLLRETSAGPVVFLIVGFLLPPIALLAQKLV
jgi:hypothetical protein